MACLFSIETVSSGCRPREQEGFPIDPMDGGSNDGVRAALLLG